MRIKHSDMNRCPVSDKTRVAYITEQAPWGVKEAFVIKEMIAMKEIGVKLIIIPRKPAKELFHKDAKSLLSDAFWLPLIDIMMIFSLIKSLFTTSLIWKIFAIVIRNARNWKVLVHNLVVIPKGVFVARLLQAKGVMHIHAHWGSVTATTAYVISALTGIRWSFTLHRYDIAENNMLTAKFKSASFVRCISEDGRRETLGLVGQNYALKLYVIHMGSIIKKSFKFKQDVKIGQKFIIICPANLVPKKGHQFLIEAGRLLVLRSIKNFKCLIAGDGPLKETILTQIKRKNLSSHIEMLGVVPNESILQMYEENLVNAVVLPSIITGDAEKEGIPVALMEAMAYRIPVVSTNTGGISELLSSGAGITVQERNAEQLANAIESLIKNRNLATNLGEQGYQRVQKEFDIRENAKKLLGLIRKHSNNVPELMKKKR